MRFLGFLFPSILHTSTDVDKLWTNYRLPLLFFSLSARNFSYRLRSAFVGLASLFGKSVTARIGSTYSEYL